MNFYHLLLISLVLPATPLQAMNTSAPFDNELKEMGNHVARPQLDNQEEVGLLEEDVSSFAIDEDQGPIDSWSRTAPQKAEEKSTHSDEEGEEKEQNEPVRIVERVDDIRFRRGPDLNPNTTDLSVGDCALSPKERAVIGQLKSLRHISIVRYLQNEKHGGRPGLSTLLIENDSVRSLSLYESQISPEYLERLWPHFISLTHLDLRNVPVSNYTALELAKTPLPSLQCLALWAKTQSAQEDKSGHAVPMNGYKALFRTLRWVQTFQLTANWSTQSNMNTYLDLAFEPLQSLRRLFVHNKEAGLGKTQALHIVRTRKDLRELRLFNFDGIDDEVAQAIAEHHPNLASLTIPNWSGSNSAIESTGATSIARLHKLRVLDLRGHRIESPGVLAMAENLRRLQVLDLRDNYVPLWLVVTSVRRPAPLELDAVIAISKLSRLTGLGISGNKVGDTEFKHLVNLKNLRELYFAESFSPFAKYVYASHPVTAEGLRAFCQQLPQLCKLTLSTAQTRGLDDADRITLRDAVFRHTNLGSLTKPMVY